MQWRMNTMGSGEGQRPYPLSLLAHHDDRYFFLDTHLMVYWLDRGRFALMRVWRMTAVLYKMTAVLYRMTAVPLAASSWHFTHAAWDETSILIRRVEYLHSIPQIWYKVLICLILISSPRIGCNSRKINNWQPKLSASHDSLILPRHIRTYKTKTFDLEHH